MRLNFYLECAGFVIGLILWCACSTRYGELDLKDHIYKGMIKSTVIVSGLNLIACVIIRRNWFRFRMVAWIIICISFLYMVGIMMGLNTYLKERIEENNVITAGDSIFFGLPLFLDALVLLMNCGTQFMYDVTRLEGNIQVVFNAWYKVPYILVILSVVIYMLLIWKGRNALLAKGQYEFFLIPILLVIMYYLQYRFKSITILGFGYSVILLLLYIYSYSSVLRRDDLTHLPDIYGFEKMIAYRVGIQQPMEVVVITVDDWYHKQQRYGYNQMKYFLIRMAEYLANNTTGSTMARHDHQFYIILEDEDFDKREQWEKLVQSRFEHEWTVAHIKENFSIRLEKVSYVDNIPDTQDIMNWVVGGMIE